MRKIFLLATCAAIAGFALTSRAQHPQPYAGQEARAIKALSEDEIRGYLSGAGMGLAKSAELNGFPGPMHVLELERELKLTADQKTRVKASMDAVKAKARDLGTKYVEAERAIELAFRDNAPEAVIRARVDDAARILADLRHAHLAAHIEITPLLSAEQRTKYAELRGYTAGSQGHGHGHGHQHKHKH
jgi:Spy/CpxP family protein refolding chaperone